MSGRTLRWILSLAHRPPREAGPRLTIVRHHRIYADGEQPLYRLGVSLSVFRAQLQLLERSGLRPVTAREGWRWLSSGESGHRVAFTFDDGYADNVHRALPALVETGAAATFYLTAGLMETRRAPWWDELAHALAASTVQRADWTNGSRSWALDLTSLAARRAAFHSLLPCFRVPPDERDARLASLRAAVLVSNRAACELATWAEVGSLREANMELGAHTLTHPHLGVIGADAQASEIEGSIDLIERRTGVRPSGFAYPGGDYGSETLALLARSRLDYAVTTHSGVNRSEAPRYELVRRSWSDGACLGPGGVFSPHLARAELDGAFDRLRRREWAA